MKKISLLLVTLLFLQACSEGETRTFKEGKLLVKEVEDIEYEEDFKFYYNADSTVQRIEAYDEGYDQVWEFDYIPGTRKVNFATISFDSYLSTLWFTHNENDQPDSAFYYSEEDPEIKSSGFTYHYNTSGEVDRIGYWNIYSEEEVTYDLTVENGNIVGYQEEDTDIEFTYNSSINPFYEQGVYLQAVYYNGAYLNFQDFLSKNNLKSIVHKTDGEVVGRTKVGIRLNKFNYPTRQIYAVGDTIYSDIRFTYYE
jgi:hypothetical protein